MAMIEVAGLTKQFDYYKKEQGLKNSIKNVFHRSKLVKDAVKDVSFTVEENEIVGLMGPNGAGKTTTMKILSGILYPTAGTCLVNGFVPWERKKQYIMNMSIVMGQRTQLNWDLPALETFYLNKCIYEVDDKDYQLALEELVEVLDCRELLKVQVRRLSLGERMKMELIASMLHKPKVIFLDEPTIGLDFISQKKIREFIEYYMHENKATILLTSHYMKDIEALCKRSIIINHGQVVYDGALSGISGIVEQEKIMRFTLSEPVATETLEQYGKVLTNDGYAVSIKVSKQEMREKASRVLEQLPVVDCNLEDLPLEDMMEKLYQE